MNQADQFLSYSGPKIPSFSFIDWFRRNQQTLHLQKICIKTQNTMYFKIKKKIKSISSFSHRHTVLNSPWSSWSTYQFRVCWCVVDFLVGNVVEPWIWHFSACCWSCYYHDTVMQLFVWIENNLKTQFPQQIDGAWYLYLKLLVFLRWMKIKRTHFG